MSKKPTNVLLTVAVISIGIGFFQCSGRNPQSPQNFEGTLRIIISGSDSKSSAPAELYTSDVRFKTRACDRKTDLSGVPGNGMEWTPQSIDQVLIKVFNETWGPISSNPLNRIDENTFEGSISVPSGRDLSVTAELWEADTLRYFAIETGVRVGKGATFDLNMTAYNFYPNLIAPTSIQNDQIDLWWTSVNNATSYLLEQDTDLSFSNNSGFYRSYQISDTQRQVPTDTSAVYYFRVRAQRAGPNPPATPSAVDSVVVVKENRFALGQGSGSSPSQGNHVPVIISNNETISALQFDVIYDSDRLSTPIPVVTIPGRRLLDGNGIIAADTLSNDTMRYVIYSIQTLELLPPGVGVVCSLSFNVNGGQSAQTIPLLIENIFISDVNGSPLSFSHTDGSFSIE